MEKPARDGRIDRMGDAPIGERISAGAVLVGLAPVCVRCVRGGQREVRAGRQRRRVG